MRIHTSIKALGTAAFIVMLTACSGGSAIAPKPALPQAGAHTLMRNIPGWPNSFRQPTIGDSGIVRPIASYYSCPATGSLEYVSDAYNDEINVYSGKFAGQAPCGQIASRLSGPDRRNLRHPSGLYVQVKTHDLYVANSSNFNVLVFHRGQTLPYNVYKDRTSPGWHNYPEGVTVASDGTVIASNIASGEGASGALSTWIGGPNGGTFVGNFLMTNDNYGGFVTVNKTGTVYFNDFDAPSGEVAVWSLTCPAGACGVQTRVTIAPQLIYPGGMEFNAEGDFVMSDIDFNTNNSADTFELPSPTPKGFFLTGDSYGVAIDKFDHHWFAADWQNNDAAEYSYPGGQLVGTVAGNPGGFLFGIAYDP